MCVCINPLKSELLSKQACRDASVVYVFFITLIYIYLLERLSEQARQHHALYIVVSIRCKWAVFSSIWESFLYWKKTVDLSFWSILVMQRRVYIKHEHWTLTYLAKENIRKPDRGSLLVYNHLSKLKVSFISSQYVAFGGLQVGKSSVLLNPILPKAVDSIFDKRSFSNSPKTSKRFHWNMSHFREDDKNECIINFYDNFTHHFKFCSESKDDDKCYFRFE